MQICGLQKSRKKIFAGLLFFLSACCWPVAAGAMDIVLAITQVQSGSTSLDGTARSRMIINHLKRLETGPVAVLVRTGEITPRTRARIAAYNDAGHLLVNTGHRHHLLSRPDPYRYQADLLAADIRLRSYSNYRGHVYLANFENDATVSNREKFSSFARTKMLTPVYVSVQVKDGYLNQRYQQKVNQNKRVDMASLQNAYVDLIWRALVSYQSVLSVTYARAPLVLLLEEHDLTAYFLPGLIDRIHDNGGRILAPQTVFTNPPVYAMPVNIQTHDGYLAALAGIQPPRLNQHFIAGGDKAWTDQYLAGLGLLQ